MKKIDFRLAWVVISLIITLSLALDFKNKLDSLNSNYHKLVSSVHLFELDFQEHMDVIKKSIINLHFNNDHFVEHIHHNRKSQNKLLSMELKKSYPRLYNGFESYKQEIEQLKADTLEFIKVNSQIKNSILILDMNLQKNISLYDKEYLKKLIQITNGFKKLKNDMSDGEIVSKDLIIYFKEYSGSGEIYKFNFIHISLLNKRFKRFKHLFNKIENSKVQNSIRDMKKGLRADASNLKESMGSQFNMIMVISVIFFIIIVLLVNNLKKDAKRILKLKKDSEKAFRIDKLTGLNNKVAFNQDIKKLNNVSIALIDITDFNSINVIAGYEGGDSVLKQLSDFLVDYRKENKTYYKNIYRVGIDQFLLVFKKKNQIEINESLSKLIGKIESHNFKYNDLELKLYIQSGVSVDTTDIKYAEIAIDKTKNSFQKISFYNETMKEDKADIHSNIQMLKKLEIALKEDKIKPFFQPIVDLKDKKPVKYEALVRLIDEEGKIISPYFFLELSKKSKHYSLITKIVIEKSFRFVEETNCHVSINLSYQDINDPATLNFILKYLGKNKNTAKHITFEILESEDVEDYDNLLKFSELIKEYGCSLAIDDFGSGYSNFTHLFNMKPDIVKIDGSLIKDIHKSQNSKNIVKALIELCRESQIKTVAEFVDNENVDQTITKMGIDFGQGYFYSPPKEDIELFKR